MRTTVLLISLISVALIAVQNCSKHINKKSSESISNLDQSSDPSSGTSSSSELPKEGDPALGVVVDWPLNNINILLEGGLVGLPVGTTPSTVSLYVRCIEITDSTVNCLKQEKVLIENNLSSVVIFPIAVGPSVLKLIVETETQEFVAEYYVSVNVTSDGAPSGGGTDPPNNPSNNPPYINPVGEIALTKGETSQTSIQANAGSDEDDQIIRIVQCSSNNAGVVTVECSDFDEHGTAILMTTGVSLGETIISIRIEDEGGLAFTQLIDVTVREEPLISSPSKPVLVAGGHNHTCAIKNSAVFCWGNNNYGQSGNMQYGVISMKPVAVRGMEEGVTAISASFRHTCAIKNNDLWCWGSNAAGELGAATTNSEKNGQPILVQSLKDLNLKVVSVNTAFHYTCATVADPTNARSVMCFGKNDNGQLGSETNAAFTHNPVPILGLSRVTDLAISLNNGCAINEGAVWCWGKNSHNQRGSPGTKSVYPSLIAELSSGVTQIAAGGQFFCALKNTETNQEVICWGFNNSGQLGVIGGQDYPNPALRAELNSLKSLGLSAESSCVTKVNGAAECWGYNSHANLARGGATTYPAPISKGLKYEVPGTGLQTFTKIIEIYQSATHNRCASFEVNGESKFGCIGFNKHGTLGNGNTNNSSSAASAYSFHFDGRLNDNGDM